MAIEKMPTTLAPRKPQHAAWYKVHKVKDGENWWSLAKEHHLDVWQLIYFNFRTHDPDEVNWYLRHYVGCTLQTPDKKNFRFSSNADPGLIYIPVQPAVLGPVPRAEKPPSTVPWKLVFRWMHLSGKIAEAEKRLYTLQQTAAQEGSRRYKLDEAGQRRKSIGDLSNVYPDPPMPGEKALDNYHRSKAMRELEEMAEQKEAELKELREEFREMYEQIRSARR